MKALVKRHAEKGLWLEDVPEPKVGVNDVLIKVDRTGICGTDVHIYEWDAWARKTIPVPMTVGHEFVEHSRYSYWGHLVRVSKVCKPSGSSEPPSPEKVAYSYDSSQTFRTGQILLHDFHARICAGNQSCQSR